jgi:hypothetical protein
MNICHHNTKYIKKFYLGEALFLTIQCVFLKYLYAYEWELVPKSVADIYRAYSLQKKNDFAIKELIWKPTLDAYLKKYPKAI